MLTLNFRCIRFRSFARYHLVSLVVMLIAAGTLQGQDEAMTEKDTRMVKNTFESIWLGDNHTVMVPVEGTFELDFQHRFGIWDNGYDDFFGVFAPSNMRIGIDFVPEKNLLLGFGFTKNNLVWDFYGKYAILKQGRSGGSPVSLTYYLNAAVDTRKKENTNFIQVMDRWSYFHEVMIARKITDAFSLQLSGNVSWFNFKESVYDTEGVYLGRDKNAHIGASALARYKFSNTMGVIVAFGQSITDNDFVDPPTHVTIGVEMVSSSHAFQIFVGNYKSLVPQYDSSFNPYDFGENQILFGFNITRLWNF